MYSPTTRVLIILELLQVHQHMSGPELARRLEVSPRSVRQYITQLQDLGIPVEANYGRNGGYRLRPGFKLPPLMFNEDEAIAITLGLLLGRAMGLTAATPAVEGALAKLERVLPESTRERVQALQNILVIDSNSPYAAPIHGVLAQLSQAAQQYQSVQLSYESWNGIITERIVEPYGLVHHGGRWFLAAYCQLRKEMRVFRIDRVSNVLMRKQTFTKLVNIDVLHFVIESLANTSRTCRIEVLLKTSLIAIQSCIPASMAFLEETHEGVRMRCAVQNLDWFAYFLFGLECEIIVHTPVELGAAFHRLSRRATAIANTSHVESS